MRSSGRLDCLAEDIVGEVGRLAAEKVLRRPSHVWKMVGGVRFCDRGRRDAKTYVPKRSMMRRAELCGAMGSCCCRA